MTPVRLTKGVSLLRANWRLIAMLIVLAALADQSWNAGNAADLMIAVASGFALGVAASIGALVIIATAIWKDIR